MTGTAARRARRAASIGVFLLTCIVASVAVAWVAIRVLTVYGIERTPMALDLVQGVRAVRAQLSQQRRGMRVLMVGDSVINPAVSFSVPTATDIALHASGHVGARMHVVPLSFPGWLIPGEYCLIDEILTLPADRIVLELNFRGLALETAHAFRQAELAGFVKPRRFGEALGLPLSQYGITADRLFFYSALVESGHADAWATFLDVQSRLYQSREPFEQSFESFFGVHSVMPRKLKMAAFAVSHMKTRDDEEHVRAVLAPSLVGIGPDYPPFVALGALVRGLVSRHRSPLVWIAPMNVDHFASLGVDLSGISATIASARRVVEQSGGHLVDFHATMRDDEFVDAGDHLTPDGERPGTDHLGRLLASAILEEEER